MIAPPTGVRVFLACGYTDMRRYAERTIMLIPYPLAECPRNTINGLGRTATRQDSA